ncbi:MAG: hypothetical protein D6776_06105, partial [Planctomycetota bacterium]
YETLAEALLDEVEAAVAREAARRVETQLEARSAALGRREPPVRFVGERVRLRTAAGGLELAALESPAVAAAIEAIRDPELAALARRAFALRLRAARLVGRRRLRDRLHRLAAEQQALQRLRESEIADADRARRALVRERRRRGGRVSAGLARPVTEIVLERAREIVRERREIERELAALEREIEDGPEARFHPEGEQLLATLRAMVPLLYECTRLEYEPLRTELERRYREVALSTAGARREDARALLRRIAFLMAKANFFPLDAATMRRGFALGPAPGVRLRVPLERFSFSCFFARGEQLDPAPTGGLAPRYEKFAFCLLERDGVARTEEDERRRPAVRPRWYDRGRRWWHSRRRRLVVAIARRHRALLVPRIDRVHGYLRRLSAVPPPDVAVDPALKLKLFRDVRLGETGLVLPGARIRYRVLDLLMVWGGAGGAFAAKVAQKPLAVLLAPKLLFSLVLAVLGRGVLGLRRSRTTLDRLQESYENRHLQATRVPVVHYFVREAVRTDAKEMLLAYGLGVKDAIERRESAALESERFTLRPERVRAAAQQLLREHFSDNAAFDLEDALGGLEAIGIVPRPGVFAPGPEPPDYFDERVIGATYRPAAIARWVERGAEAADPAASRQEPAADIPALPPQVPVLAPQRALARLRERIRSRLGV